MVLLGEDEIVRSWVSQKTGDHYAEGETLGILSTEGRLVGGFVFTNHTGASIDMSLAGKGCVTRFAWQAAGEFVFGMKRCQRLQVVTRHSNKTVRRMAPRFKMKFEGRLRRFYGDEDGLLFSLLRDEAIALGYYKEPVH